jgi:hypothetical protein
MELIRQAVNTVLGSPGPRLNVLNISTNAVLVYWRSPSTGFGLRQNTILGTTNWTTPPETIQDDGTNQYLIASPPTNRRFFRLSKP